MMVARQQIANAIESQLLATTSITLFELLSGASSPAERKKVETLLSPLTILPLDEDSAIAASEIRLALERRGRGIGMADYLIAGICLSLSHSLLTRNRSTSAASKASNCLDVSARGVHLVWQRARV